MSLRRTLWGLALGAALMLAGHAAQADKIGIVVMHGKLGTPIGTGGPGGAPMIGGQLIAALKAAGYLVATPEMCWSRRRGFDKTFPDCLAEINPVVATLKAQGATAIVVSGLSLGGHAAIAYGATHAGLLGIIGFAPADDAARKARRPEIAEALERARALVAAGKGDERQSFTDINTGPQGSYRMALLTTPRIYLSFFDPQTGSIADKAAKLTAPLLWVAGNADPSQREAATSDFPRVAPNPHNRFVTVTANHLTTPDVGRDAAIAWLAEIQKR